MLCEWLEYIFCDGKYESIKSSSDNNEASGFIISNLMVLIRLVAFLVIVRLRGQIKYLSVCARGQRTGD